MGGTAIHGESFTEQVLTGPAMAVSVRLKLAYARIFTGKFLESLRKDFGLSPRQAEIVVLICKGVPAARIARALGVEVGTVKAHRRAIYGRLGVTCVEQCIAKAMLNHVSRLLGEGA